MIMIPPSRHVFLSFVAPGDAHYQAWLSCLMKTSRKRKLARRASRCAPDAAPPAPGSSVPRMLTPPSPQPAPRLVPPPAPPHVPPPGTSAHYSRSNRQFEEAMRRLLALRMPCDGRRIIKSEYVHSPGSRMITYREVDALTCCSQGMPACLFELKTRGGADKQNTTGTSQLREALDLAKQQHPRLRGVALNVDFSELLGNRPFGPQMLRPLADLWSHLAASEDEITLLYTPAAPLLDLLIARGLWTDQHTRDLIARHKAMSGPGSGC